MAIVQICNDYVDTAPAGTIYYRHHCVPLDDGRTVVFTNTIVNNVVSINTIARFYTITNSGWTRSAAVDTSAVRCHWARACAATMDGHVLVSCEVNSTPDIRQGGYYVLDAGSSVPIFTTGYAYAPSASSTTTSEPDSMVRLPNTNTFFAWRTNNAISEVSVDAILVNGTTPQFLSRVVVDTYANPSIYLVRGPHQIIPISSTEAISMISYSNGSIIYLVHLRLIGTTISASRVQVTGYGITPDGTLYPGLNHQGEMMMVSPTDPTVLQRIGVDWNGTSFTQTSLPLTQLAADIAPPNYEAPRNMGSLRLAEDACFAASGTGYLFVTRRYVSDNSDDNWWLTTQYNLDDGSIVTNAWAKGELNGGTADQLFTADLNIRYDRITSHVLVTGADTLYPDSDSNNGFANPRLTAYRDGYSITEAFRDRRTAFEY